MYIPVSRINPGSLTRSPHQAAKASGEPSALSFPETLAAVAAAIEDQVRRIRKKYALSVRVTAVSKDGKESTGRAIRDDWQEIEIAPNILQQMSKDPVMQRKVYGYLEEYTGDDHAADYGLTIHKDGTCTRRPSPQAGESRQPSTGPVDAMRGSGAREWQQQLAFIRARRSNRRP